jgi:hypothetical protein
LPHARMTRHACAGSPPPVARQFGINDLSRNAHSDGHECVEAGEQPP